MREAIENKRGIERERKKQGERGRAGVEAPALSVWCAGQ